MRGKVFHCGFCPQLVRITPAYAGKSTLTFPFFTVYWDHPRLCGEKFTYLRAFFHFVGSPPPMRGKEMFVGKIVKRKWITPAYAGKSESGRSTQKHGKDHPRLCGEKMLRKSHLTALSGSPPPMRGKAQNRGERRRVHRITPAYAGKRL